MKIRILLAIVVLCLGLIHGCKKIELQNQWADNPVTIDGKSADWQDVPLQYLEESNIMIGSVNDEDNLYVMFRFNDQVLVRKIQRFGVTVWIDEKGKKDKNYGIRYFTSIELEQELRPNIEAQANIPEERDQKMVSMMAARTQPGRIIAISGDEEESLPDNSESGPSAGSASQQGVFCYEFRIPFPFGTKLTKPLSLGLEIGGVKLEDFKRRGGMRPDGMGGPAGGMRRPPRGMAGRGPESGDRMPREQMFEKQEVWMKVLLAESKEHGA